MTDPRSPSVPASTEERCACSQVVHFMEPTGDDEEIHSRDLDTSPDQRGHYPQCPLCGMEKLGQNSRKLHTYHCKLCGESWEERDDQKHLPNCRYFDASDPTASQSLSSGAPKVMKMLTEAEFVERLTPKRLDQVPNGCWVACIAGLTTIPHGELSKFVPESQEDSYKDPGYHNAVNRLMREAGFRIAYIGPDVPWGFAIGTGLSPRGFPHCVITLNGAVWHDPHPSRSGIESITDYEVIIPIKRVQNA